MKLAHTSTFLLFALLVSGCGTSGISLNSLYLKQNYAAIVQHANNYETIDDYGVLKICQSLAKVQMFDDFYICLDELKRRSQQQGTLSGQVGKPIPASLTEAMVDTMLAEIELGLGNYPQSVAHGERALSLLDAEPYSVDTIVDVAETNYEVVKILLGAYPAMDNRVKTRSMIERARGLANFKYRGDSGFRLIRDFKILPILTNAYYALGNYEESLRYSKLTLELQGNLGILESTFFTAMTALNSTVMGEQTAEGKLQTFQDTMFAHQLQPTIIKARSELELGHYAEAAIDFDTILSTRLIAGIPGMHYPVLHDTGRVAEALGDDESAKEYYLEAIDVIENSRSSIKSDASKIAYVGNKQAVYESLVAILFKHDNISEAFEAAESAKARALVDLLASKGLDDPLKVDLDHNISESAKELNLIQSRMNQKGIAETQNTRGADRSLLIETREKLSKDAPEYASLVMVESDGASDIQNQLADGDLLLEYYGNQDTLFIFALTNKHITAARISAVELEQSIGLFRKSLIDVNSDNYKIQGRKIYDRLIKPVQAEFDRAMSVSIVPHGALHYLPFDALYTGSNFVIDTRPVRILPSASVLKFLNNSRSDNSRSDNTAMLLLGNPDLEDRQLDLAGAQAEAIAIANAASNAKLLLRGDATETAVKREGRAYKYLHFASHGVFDEKQPLNSSLLLSKDAENDGRLTVSELYGLKLNADLVTLSACETALGEVANGDDVIGFTRGFLYAGANSIVSSLWQVDDEATSQLMQHFYGNLNSMDKRAALTRAQLSVKENYPHPFYWGAFQLTGAY